MAKKYMPTEPGRVASPYFSEIWQLWQAFRDREPAAASDGLRKIAISLKTHEKANEKRKLARTPDSVKLNGLWKPMTADLLISVLVKHVRKRQQGYPDQNTYYTQELRVPRLRR
jgi:hypothetical protein